MWFKNFLVRLYRFQKPSLRFLIKKIAYNTEGGEFFSSTLRRIMKKYHDVEIGMYTQGECFNPRSVDRYTKIGRYCSIAPRVRIINVNHPLRYKSTHSLFWVHAKPEEEKKMLQWIPIEIGNDVWIGHGAIILPNVTSIGDGAVIAAGSLVNKNIPPYAVVAGFPARIVRYRFSKEIIEKLLAEKWWEKDFEELKSHFHEFQTPYPEEAVNEEFAHNQESNP